ncbi:glycoside hydrolase family 31 protein [Georgenia deserti]|uniref:Glycoside hydrolase family 31 protein n=1 Tax=Georgenia deserti TaxID=2093781 RepID=A0ABW4L0L0_9MICO
MRIQHADPVASTEAVVAGDHYRLTVLTDGLIRLEFSPDGAFEDRASTFAINRRLPVPDFTVSDAGTHLELTTARLRVTYDRQPFSANGLSVAVRGPIDAVWRYGQPSDDLGGTARTLDNADGAVPLGPGVAGRRGIAVIDDSESFLFDGEWIGTRRPGRLDVYVFAYGRDVSDALQAFYAVSGLPPVLPRYALGNWWSRFYPYTTESYQEVVRRFRSEQVPISVSVIDMDWHLTEIDPEHGVGWTGYTWNQELFPDPEAFLTWLHDQGMRVTLNLHPAEGVRSFEAPYPAMARALGREPDGTPIPFDITDARFAEAYLDMHRDLEAQGVDFWWIDWQQGEHTRLVGVDPLWVLNHLHFIDSARDERRGLILSRYAGPGSHRYPVGFSGDTVISWDSLAFQVAFTATAANVGYGWWSHDIGGHFGGVRDDELTTRWVQLGTFSPVLRLHSGRNPFLTKEPWSFEEPVRGVIDDFLRLRHRLVPYLHTMNHRAASGTPLVRPLYHAHPGTTEAYERSDQFLFGSEVMLAPITSPHDEVTQLGSVRTWLPEGTWVDLLTELVYDGGREIVMHRDLASVPVLAPAGAIVPTDGARSLGNEPVNPEHVEVVVVVGADGEFVLVEDDDTAGGALAGTTIRFDQATGRLRIAPPEGETSVLPRRRTWTVTFPALAGNVVQVEIGGAQVDGSRLETASDTAPVRGDTAGRLAPAARCSITVPDVPLTSGVVVDVGPSPVLHDNPVDAELFRRIDRARIGHETKNRLYRLLTAPIPVASRLSGMQALGLAPEMVNALSEVFLARA